MLQLVEYIDGNGRFVQIAVRSFILQYAAEQRLVSV